MDTTSQPSITSYNHNILQRHPQGVGGASVPKPDATTPEEGEWRPKTREELQYPVSALVKFRVILHD